MELRDVVRARRMVRAYDPDRPVPPLVLRELLDAATRAPSAGSSQGWDLLVLRELQDRDRFWSATAHDVASPDRWLAGMRTAPVVVVCLSDPGAYRRRYAQPDKAGREEDRDPMTWPVPWWDVDTGMAALLVLLTAVDQGLGACFFGVPGSRHDAVRTTFAVPPDRRLVAALTIGYPRATTGPRTPRRHRPLAEVAHEGRFGTPLREDGAGPLGGAGLSAAPAPIPPP